MTADLNYMTSKTYVTMSFLASKYCHWINLPEEGQIPSIDFISSTKEEVKIENVDKFASRSLIKIVIG